MKADQSKSTTAKPVTVDRDQPTRPDYSAPRKAEPRGPQPRDHPGTSHLIGPDGGAQRPSSSLGSRAGRIWQSGCARSRLGLSGLTKRAAFRRTEVWRN